MKTIRNVAAGAVLAVAVVACSNPEADVESSFRGYHEALLARDFPAACALNSPEATAKLLATVRTRSIVVGTCEDAFAAIFAEPGAAETADGIARSVQVQDVAVTGDDARITWSASLEGEPRTATNVLRRVDGEWRLMADS